MGRQKESEVLVAASVFAVASALLAFLCISFTKSDACVWALVPGALAGMSLLACVVCLDIWRLSPANSHSLKTLMSQYIYILRLRRKASKIIRGLLEDFEKPEKVQRDELMQTIRKNADTAYGKDHGFSKMKTREDFLRMHPLTTYERFRSYVDRIAQGEKNVLTSDEVIFLANSSATTGKIKRYPLAKNYGARLSKLVSTTFIGSRPIMNLVNLKRMHKFYLFTPVMYTEGGKIPYGPGSNYIITVPNYNTVPDAYSRVYKEKASYYAQALFCLAERELNRIEGFSATLMYSFFKFIDENIEELCQSISSGTVSAKAGLDSDIREELSARMHSDPARAAELRANFAKGIVGVGKRIWPDLQLVMMGKSASFAMCAKILQDSYLKGVHISGSLHGASEGLLGIVLEKEPWVGEVETMVPYPCFWEFIPLEEVDTDNPTTLMMHQLTKGQLYEIVVTNENGLYRCRFGDVIKVVGFNRNTPKYEFQYRLGQRLNIGFERTPEKTLYEALVSVSKKLPSGTSLLDYTTTESFVVEQITDQKSLGHYVYFVEVSGTKDNQFILTDEHADQIDKALCEMREAYEIHRSEAKGSIGPPRIIQVKGGTFDELKRQLWGPVPNGQFKMPRVLRKIPAIEFLLKNQIE